jgi:hypothetical protein
MALVINKQEEFEYIPVDFKEDENPFKVVFKPLSPSELASLDDAWTELNTAKQTLTIKTGTYNLNVLRYSLLRWSGVEDAEGKPVTLEIVEGKVTESSLDYIPMSIRDEIANVISAVSKDIQNADLYLGNTLDIEGEDEPKTTKTKSTRKTTKTKSDTDS